MANQIGGMSRDVERFRQIIRKLIRKDIGKYITRGDIIHLPKGKGATIPMPSRIILPRFRHADGQGGVGHGLGENNGGEVGDEILNDPPEHERTVEISIPELLEMLAEELELPNLEPKDAKTLEALKHKYTTRARVGPHSLIHKRESLKQAIKRSAASGITNPQSIMIEPRDFRYKSFRRVPEPHHQAVVFFLMDISGSIDEESSEIIRIESFWIEQWITKFYPKTVMRFLVHDSHCFEVSRDDFFSTQSNGGTSFFPAYNLINTIIEKDYPLAAWNIYCFHWTDGDILEADQQRSGLFLRRILVPKLNMFGYEQIRLVVKNGEFADRLDRLRKTDPELKQKIRLSNINDQTQIPKSLKRLLGK